ncbi:ABC transporter ATP-binding protein/permease [Siculibacillus lacustris]|uniref:ABC transporter ATP-binding protein/permease n=1 Tax=Siculibacillus lacustris TaxID=1549641 RepID=A0A4Q9VWA2_9HYPH|nr:ribosome-associated ATPase/putative transporter RbbA [Siculibacillus lacustris]TBW39520.1 ABC transporter ATP-binding protein/permease [Siculibacillus lacustris]
MSERRTGAAATAVAVTALGHRYGAGTALAEVTLAFATGSSTALIGPDGVGKSTLLGLITGVRAIQSGEIAVFGGSMRERRVRDGVAARIAYMPQGLGRNLYPALTVAENVDFHARLFGLDAAARAARLTRLLAATGLDPFADRPAGQLSGGMKQKLSLCCALVHDPDLLVLDEPTTGVDPLSRRQFWDLIDDIHRSRPTMTVIVATAYIDEAGRFGRVIALDAGRVVADGTVAEILAKTGEATLDDAYRRLGRAPGEALPPAFVMPPRVANDAAPAIEAHDLTRRFGAFTAVDHVSFRIGKGEIFGFLGSNGCGKTTTMKMLTGLLPASEGSATLLGVPVDADDITVRLRVGYVSQSFSLYEELTVRANLVLHARLYRLAEAAVTPRVDESLARFGLAEVADAYPTALPLGVRQRLQLAAACLHRPEVLILDEPTSGVDPQARDDFWRFLAELSRRDGVTIFVSTHFMNEAERCDRISLMHLGRVLAVGPPAELVRAAGAATLEEAFISSLETAEAAAAGPKAAAPAIAGAPAAEAPATTAAGGVDTLATTWAFARREGLELLRDPVRLSFAILGSLLLFVLFGYGISFDVENLPYAVFDRDRSIESGRLIDAFSGSRYFAAQAPIADDREVDRRLVSGELRLVLGIPPGFGADLIGGRRPEVSVWIDGANTFRAETVKAYVQGVVLAWATERAGDVLGPTGVPALMPFDLRPRFAYNQAFLSLDAITPGVIMLLLVLIPAVMTAVGVAREREIGSIANFQASPAPVFAFMVGKQIPYVVVAMISFGVLFAFARLFFGVHFQGSFVALTIGAALYVMAATGFGLLVSTLVRTQVAAIMATAILCVVPTINFSGFINPMSSIEGVTRWVGLLFPAAWFQTIALGSFAKGVGALDLLTCDLALAGFALVFIGGACALLAKQEK